MNSESSPALIRQKVGVFSLLVDQLRYNSAHKRPALLALVPISYLRVRHVTHLFHLPFQLHDTWHILLNTYLPLVTRVHIEMRPFTADPTAHVSSLEGFNPFFFPHSSQEPPFLHIPPFYPLRRKKERFLVRETMDKHVN